MTRSLSLSAHKYEHHSLDPMHSDSPYVHRPAAQVIGRARARLDRPARLRGSRRRALQVRGVLCRYRVSYYDGLVTARVPGPTQLQQHMVVTVTRGRARAAGTGAGGTPECRAAREGCVPPPPRARFSTSLPSQ
jgi:hypothetical protein